MFCIPQVNNSMIISLILYLKLYLSAIITVNTFLFSKIILLNYSQIRWKQIEFEALPHRIDAKQVAASVYKGKIFFHAAAFEHSKAQGA